MSSRVMNDEMRDFTAAWWLYLVIGLISVAAGVIVLAKPSDSLATLAVVAGVFVLLDGAFALVASISRHTENRGMAAILGVLGVVVGVLLIRRLIAAFELEHRAWHIVVALVEVAAGIVIVSTPPIGFATLALLVGIEFIANGVMDVALGWLMHSARHETAGPELHAGLTA